MLDAVIEVPKVPTIVMIELAPIVLEAMTFVSPAPGPAVIWIEYPRRSLCRFRVVLTVEVVPPEAVPEGPTAVAVPDPPAAIAGVRAPDGICVQPSSPGWYR
jgi:hypothetical protein